MCRRRQLRIFYSTWQDLQPSPCHSMLLNFYLILAVLPPCWQLIKCYADFTGCVTTSPSTPPYTSPISFDDREEKECG